MVTFCVYSINVIVKVQCCEFSTIYYTPFFFGTIKHTFSSGWERGKCIYGVLLNVVVSIVTLNL